MNPFANLISTIEDALTDEYATMNSLKRNLITVLIHLTRHDAVGTFATPHVPEPIPSPFPNRFRIVTTSPDGMGTYELYCLDGRVTNSKISAIKYIRQIENENLMGLRESKDYVESLPGFFTDDFYSF